MDARTRRLTLVACVLGSSVVLVDSTAVTVALAQIQEGLGGGLSGQQWVSNAYLVTLGSLLLVGGALGDVLGERRVFTAGVAGFGLASVLCALAPTIELLVAARALQGVAGAALVPAALAVIVASFERGERNRAIATWTAWSGIGAATGPLIGGWLVDAASWRWVFLINVPLVLATVVLILRAVGSPQRDATKPRRLDLVGALLCTLGLAGLTGGLIQQPLAGWGSATVLGPILLGAAIFAGFLAWEARHPEPMLPLGLFARRNFAVGNLETLMMYAGLSVLLFYLALFLQQVAGYRALEAGLATLPVSIVMLILAGRFGGLADRHGPRLLMGAGPLVSAAGLLLFLRLDASVSYFGDVLPAIVCFALGLSMTVAPLTATVLADAEERTAGVASGINNAIARVAGLVGIAAVGVAISAGFAGSIDDELAGARLSGPAQAAVDGAEDQPLVRPSLDGVPPRERARIDGAVEQASVSSFHTGMGVSGALIVLAGLLGGVAIRNPRRTVAAGDCPGGSLVGTPADGARRPEECGERSARAAEPVAAGAGRA